MLQTASDTFNFVMPAGVDYKILHLRPPWAFHVPSKHFGGLYYLKHGFGWFWWEDEVEPQRFNADEGVAFSAERGHVWSSTPRAKQKANAADPQFIDVSDWSDERRLPGDTVMIVARNDVAQEAYPHMYPKMVALREADQPAQSRIATLLNWIEVELRIDHRRPGADSLIRFFTQAMMAELLRLSERDQESELLWRSAGERGVAKALGRMVHSPGEKWTIDRLAFEAGLSRSGFCERFKSVTGVSPIAYLTRVRLHEAARLLDQGLPMGIVADHAGYKSEAAFNRAFRRVCGATPGERQLLAASRARSSTST